MEISTLQDVVVDALEDVKGQQIEVFDTTAITDLFDRVIIVSGTSNRQTRALAMSVVEAVRKIGGHIISTEGEETGEWVLVDCGDLIVHIMQPAIRTYYNLEELWGQTAIDVTAEKRSKFARGKAVKASGKVATAADKKVVTKGVKKAVTKEPAKVATKVATKVAAKVPAKVATKVPTKAPTKVAAKVATKVPAKIATKSPTKTAAKTVKKVVTVKATPAKKTVTTDAVTKKAPAKKPTKPKV